MKRSRLRIATGSGEPDYRYGRPEEIASFIAYLAGPEASNFTGASLPIDGGFTA